MDKPFIILGMHRSGTSLITQWLSHCGLHVGLRLLNEGIGNDEGHFEDLDFVEWHEQVLKENGLPDTGFIDQQSIKISAQQVEKIDQILQRKDQLMWGWKDPRTCLFIDFYQQHIPNAHYLVIVRDYQAVISSLIKRDLKLIKHFYFRRTNIIKRLKWRLYKKEKLLKQYNMKKMMNVYAKTYIRYNQEILRLLQKDHLRKNIVVLDYTEVLKNDHKYLNLINEVADMDLKYVSFSEIYKPNLMSGHHYFDEHHLLQEDKIRLEQIYQEIRAYLN